MIRGAVLHLQGCKWNLHLHLFLFTITQLKEKNLSKQKTKYAKKTKNNKWFLDVIICYNCVYIFFSHLIVQRKH